MDEEPACSAGSSAGAAVRTPAEASAGPSASTASRRLQLELEGPRTGQAATEQLQQLAKQLEPYVVFVFKTQ